MNRVTLLIIFLLAILGGLILHETVAPTGFIYNYLHPTAPPTPHRRRPMVVPPWYSGLAPQKAVDVDGVGDPTRDTYQRKIFNDGTNFFLSYLGYNTSTLKYEIRYVASSEGKTWTSPTVLWILDIAPYSGGNIDVCYPNRGTTDYWGASVDLAMHFTGCLSAKSIWRPLVISGQTLVKKVGADLGGPTDVQGASLVSNLNGVNDYMIYHRNTVYDRVYAVRTINYEDDYDTTVPFGATISGGNQLLPYKTSSPYQMLAIAKGGDNKLYYNIVNEPTATFIYDSFIEIATLETGFSDFCACSEAQNVGDPERIHLVYIKSTGELCYNKFENDALGDEIVLVESGASYPVIAVGSNGKLYIKYVKDGSIWVIHYDGSNWLNPLTLFPEHTYNNPTYLSTNQNVQSGKICLVWTEGTNSPYEVWFSYIND